MGNLEPTSIVGGARLFHADCRDVLRSLPDNSIHACVTDPPYALVSIVKRFGKPNSSPAKGNDAYMRASAGFMSKTWDTGEVAFSEEFWSEVLRVLKPGGHVVAFSGTRTYHRMAVAIEDAGFEIRDQLGWLYGCLDEKTMAVTSDGVMPYHKINKGDLVLSYNTTYMTYEWQPVEEVLVYDVDDTVYRIATDYGEQVVSRNHRCIVERGGKEVFQLAEEAARQREIRVPVLEDLRALLDAIPSAYSGAGEAQQDVLAGVREVNSIGKACCCGGKAGGDACGEIHGDMHCVRDGVLEEHEAHAAREESSLLVRVQRSAARSGVEGTRAQGQGELDAGVGVGFGGADDRRDESGMEGRGDVSKQEGELRHSSVRSLPDGVLADVTQGRVRDGASLERRDSHWSPSDTGGVRASYRPQSSQQRTGESNAVCDEQGSQTVRAWRGHKTVVGRITPERYRGVIWCVRVKSGAFVAVRNGFAFPTGNSGFPKSHNQHGDWEGWGTALKPAWEPIALARKPLDGTVAANLSAWGVGAINVDGCRVGDDGGAKSTGDGVRTESQKGAIGAYQTSQKVPGLGRWPANIVHDGSDEVLAAFPETKSGKPGVMRKGVNDGACYGAESRPPGTPMTGFGDSGSAARFFYCAKASRKDRDEGLDAFPEVTVTGGGGTNSEKSDAYGAVKANRRNVHPTVKPTSLMQWLCRLVTPPGGTILDPFMGSGSTGKAALLEGFNFVGCEREDEYMPIAQARIAAALRPVALARQRGAANDNQPQADLFAGAA